MSSLTHDFDDNVGGYVVEWGWCGMVEHVAEELVIKRRNGVRNGRELERISKQFTDIKLGRNIK